MPFPFFDPKYQFVINLVTATASEVADILHHDATTEKLAAKVSGLLPAELQAKVTPDEVDSLVEGILGIFKYVHTLFSKN